jgi:3-deoxy-D-manno-octulosonic-acid transferase
LRSIDFASTYKSTPPLIDLRAPRLWIFLSSLQLRISHKPRKNWIAELKAAGWVGIQTVQNVELLEPLEQLERAFRKSSQVHYFVYNFWLTVFFVAALPLLPLWLMLRPRLRSGLGERFGCYARTKLQPVIDARPIWIHAASVGETFAARALITAVKAKLPQGKILLSTFTDTGNEIARRSAGADAVIFLPIDHPLVVRRTLTKLEPAVLIIIETEIWPNLLRQAYKRGIPVLLLSGRLSERAFNRYLTVGGFFRSVLGCFAACGMQSVYDADRIARLGADTARIIVTGNLKQPAPMPCLDAGSTVKAAEAGLPDQKRPLLVAGSTHRGEEALLLEIFLALKNRFPALQLALAPRHPERFAEVEKLLQQRAVNFSKKSALKGLSFQSDVLLVDTLGDLRNLYALSDVAFVGGSLVDVGGHNLLEPAGLKKPVLFGPYTANCASVAAALKKSGGGIEVRDHREMLREFDLLLSDPVKRRSAGEKAYGIAMIDGAVVERSLELLGRYVDLGDHDEFRRTLAGPRLYE